MIPNGVFTPYPPAKDCPPGPVWQEAQCPAAARASPRATDSGEKLAGAGRSIGGITRRQDKSKKPASPRTATARIPIAMRRIIAPLFSTPAPRRAPYLPLSLKCSVLLDISTRGGAGAIRPPPARKVGTGPMSLRGNGLAQSPRAGLLLDLSARRLAKAVGLWECRQGDRCLRRPASVCVQRSWFKT